MTSLNLSITQKWIREQATHYPASDRVYSDIDLILNKYPNLRPKSDVYTYDDGRTQLLICIHGLLPITYRQASYNIPIALWIPRDFPREPPIVFVVPTSDMLVKAGKYLDVSGRFNPEYLLHWERKYEGCNLSALLEVMQEQFSREPPVYAKPKNPVQLPPTTTAFSAQTSISSSPVPALPPKPGSSRLNSPQTEPPRQFQGTPPAAYSPSPYGHGSAFANRPPLPPPPSSELPPPQYIQPQFTPSPLHADPNHQHHPFHTPNQSWTASTQNGLPTHPPGPAQHVQPPAQTTPSHLPHVHPPHIPTLPSVPIPNILDDDETIPSQPTSLPTINKLPPRPPNPELIRLHAQLHQKLVHEMLSLTQAMTTDTERLRAQQADLLLGEPAIRDEISRLEAVGDVCRNVASRMRATVEQAERNVSDLRRKGDPEVDELVCSTSIVHNQLINLVAEDNAIEDTIYHLHRALNTGRIDLDRFLRTTRVLAEEQFMKRALIEKIQTGLPIGRRE